MENEQYDQKQQLLNKYKSDLEFLENGRELIIKNNQNSLTNKDTNKRLNKLNKSIETLRKLITDFDSE